MWFPMRVPARRSRRKETPPGAIWFPASHVFARAAVNKPREGASHEALHAYLILHTSGASRDAPHGSEADQQTWA